MPKAQQIRTSLLPAQAYMYIFSPVSQLYQSIPQPPSNLLGVVLLMVVDLVVPEKSLQTHFRQSPPVSNSNHSMAYLVSVTPEEVLGPDVLVRVLRELFAWGLVGLVLPVLVPEAPGVDTGDAEGGDDDTGGDCEYFEGGG